MLYHKTFKHKKSETWVVFVHGAGGSNVVWFRQLREFKKHFNVLLVDLRGHGKSKKEYSKGVLKPILFHVFSKKAILSGIFPGRNLTNI